jgi:hypothetical protein
VNDPASPPEQPSVARLERQLHAFKVILGILIVCMLATIAAYLYRQHMGDPVTLWINGKAIATVRNQTLANQAITEAEHSRLLPGYPPESIVRIESVALRPAAPDASLDTDADASAKIAAAITVHLRAYVIMVNDKPSLGLPTQDAADQTLALVKQHFADMPPKADLIGDPQFRDKVVVKYAAVSISRARSTADEAAPYFWTPPPVKTAVVKPGDTGTRIARRYHLSLTDFITANSSINVNKLMPGDMVNVEKMPLLLTVRVKKRLGQDESIVANESESQGGRRHVSYVVTYLNGQETRRDVLGMVTVVKPRTRRTLD